MRTKNNNNNNQKQQQRTYVDRYERTKRIIIYSSTWEHCNKILIMMLISIEFNVFFFCLNSVSVFFLCFTFTLDGFVYVFSVCLPLATNVSLIINDSSIHRVVCTGIFTIYRYHCCFIWS